ncbi:hypothetical protein [Thermotalea metallivorans]|uniref:Uncharacterized protein n=1 Tax=Thermotalea metallivorans TaxID=520762 RepID=A0A140KZD2_9FIRM|nr:hypothetical protein [Thermotalea metallivorans]KXG73657.1 hypothetical protein AN619_30250 [Thermotalea metallivorans]
MLKELNSCEMMKVNGGGTVTRGGVKYDVTISDEAKQQYKSYVVYTGLGMVAAAVTGGASGVFTTALASAPIELAAQSILYHWK